MDPLLGNAGRFWKVGDLEGLAGEISRILPWNPMESLKLPA